MINTKPMFKYYYEFNFDFPGLLPNLFYNSIY